MRNILTVSSSVFLANEITLRNYYNVVGITFILFGRSSIIWCDELALVPSNKLLYKKKQQKTMWVTFKTMIHVCHFFFFRFSSPGEDYKVFYHIWS